MISAAKGLALGVISSVLVFISSILLFVINAAKSLITKQPKNIVDPSTILITGASSGIGKALAERYSKAGRTLILVGRDEARLNQTKVLCEKRGARAVIKSIDVTDREGLKKFIVSMDEQHPIDLVVANAGVTQGTLGVNAGDVHEYIHTLFDINVNGVLNTVMPLVPLFKARKQGQIAIVSSLMCYIPKQSAYSASKAAITSLGLCLRSDLSAYNIRVSVVVPPYVKTPMTDKNNFSMPLMMTAEAFVAMMQKGLAADEAVIAPFLPYLAAWLLHTIPPALSSWLVHRAPRRGGSRPPTKKKD